MFLHYASSDLKPLSYDDLKTRQIAQRWCVLAEKRLDYLNELLETGRWRRFHNEIDFFDNLEEARDAVARWQAMADGRFAMPASREVPPVPVPQAAVIEQVVIEAEVVSFEDHVSQRAAARPVEQEPAAASDITDWTRPVDLDAIRDRYPILRAAM